LYNGAGYASFIGSPIAEFVGCTANYMAGEYVAVNGMYVISLAFRARIEQSIESGS